MPHISLIYLFCNKKTGFSHKAAGYHNLKVIFMAKKIYLGSLKGGAGVTTVCVGLGLALAGLGERTLLVDGDARAACAMTVAGLGNMQVYTLADYEKSACRAKQTAFMHPDAHNLHIMPSLGMKNPATIPRAVGEVEGLYDVILLDKAEGVRCDRAAVVTEPYVPSLRAAECLCADLADGGMKGVWVIVNKINGGQVLGGETPSAEQIAKFLRAELLAQIPEDAAIAVGKWRQSTVNAFKAAARAVTGKGGAEFDPLKGYTGLNGYIKRKLRYRI